MLPPRYTDTEISKRISSSCITVGLMLVIYLIPMTKRDECSIERVFLISFLNMNR